LHRLRLPAGGVRSARVKYFWGFNARTQARNRSDPTTAPTNSGVLTVEAGVEATMLVVEDERPGVVGVGALVIAVVAAAVVVALVGGLVAVHVATGRLEQGH
jgi:hypothetical protein